MNIIKKGYCRLIQLAFRLALPLLPYREPVILNTMSQAADLLKDQNLSGVLIVTDKGIVQAGLLRELTDRLETAQIAYTIFDETVANPTISNVESARDMYLTHNCQAVIGFGGGSSMDCAKITAARIAKPEQPISKMKGLLKIRTRLPLMIAIPTTAGTGSETTLAAVITNETTHHKYPINDFCLIPPYAVLDYQVTLGLPAHLTATTGMDALTHAVEAYIGNSTTAYTRQMAREAVLLISRNLKQAYENGQDVPARQNMLRASYCAGAAFTQSYVGYVHAIAHSLGGQYGTPHGLANAVILPHMLKKYGESCHQRLGRLAKECGLAPFTDTSAQASAKFISWIEEMNRSMQLPVYLKEIRTEDIPRMAAHADKESNPLYPVPSLLDRKELESMYYIISGRPAP